MEIQPQIAIIGTGIGGASAAHFLTDFFPKAKMDIYEASPKVGGRLSTIESNGYQYESGGALIHTRNKYMVNFRRQLKLKKRKFKKIGVNFAVYKEYDNSLMYKVSKYLFSFLNALRLIWNCGTDFFKLTETSKSMLNNFTKIYRLQNQSNSYETPVELLKAMNLSHLIGLTFNDYLVNQIGLDDDILSNLVLPAMRMNYGQGLEVPAFLGMVSLAGGMDGDLWAVNGGNALIVEKLIEKVLTDNRNARLFKSTPVQSIKRRDETQSGPRFEVTTTTGRSNNATYYDIVILAVPLRVDDDKPNGKRIMFHNIVPDPYTTAVTKYHPLWVYYCDGQRYKPNKKLFGDVDSSWFGHKKVFCDAILTTQPLGNDSKRCVEDRKSTEKENSFNSITLERPVNYNKKISDKTYAWRIFVNAPLNNSYILEHLLEAVPGGNHNKNLTESVKATHWYAYPEYSCTYNRSIPSFTLSADNGFNGRGGGLYHIGAIEWAASAMEMSAIGAKNVALLARKNWLNKMKEAK